MSSSEVISIFALSITVAAVAVASIVFYQLLLHPLSRYPGPLLAKFTNFWRLATFLRGSQHAVDVALHRRYGPIVRDGPNSLLVADLDVYRSIYGFNKPEVIRKGDFYRAMWNGDHENPNIFAASTEAQHRNARRVIVSPALSPKHVAQYTETAGNMVAAYIADLDREIGNAGAGKTATKNIVPGIECLIFDTMLSVTYGSSMGLLLTGRDTRRILAAKDAVWPMSISVSQVPWLARLFSIKIVSALLNRTKYNAQGEPVGIGAVAQWSTGIRKKAKQDPSFLPPCLLKNLLTVDGGDSRKADDERVRFECFNVVFAGTGSTTAGLIAVFYELARHPEFQSRILHDSTGGEVLQAVIKESLRVHPPFAAPFERVVAQKHETALNVPVGTRVWSNGYVIARDKSVYGGDAEDWRPERWLKGGTREMEDIYPVFGRGSRGCIGKGLALMVMEKAVMAVLERWELTCEEKLELRGRNAFEMQYRDVNVMFTPRT